MFFELSDKVEFVGKAAFLSDVEDGHGTVLAEQAFSEIHAGDDEVLVGRSFENGLIEHIEARLGKVNLLRHMGNRPVFAVALGAFVALFVYFPACQIAFFSYQKGSQIHPHNHFLE